MIIFYTCDDNFVWLAGISIISICETNRELEQIDFYLLGDHISEKNKQLPMQKMFPKVQGGYYQTKI